VILLIVASYGGLARAQFGGGGEGQSDRAATAKAELKAAVERAEEMMDASAGEEFGGATPTDACKCVGEAASAVVGKIEQALDGPLRSNGLDFVDTPLEEVVNLLQEDYGIPIQIDRPALDEIGMEAAEQVTVQIHNVSFRSALRLLLRQLQLTYLIQNEVLLITTPESAESELKLCVYDLRGLVDTEQPKSLAALVDAIVSCIASETWAENGGGGAEIRPLPPRLLAITQTQGVHEEIRGFLDTIRVMHPQSSGPRATAEPEPAE
jgi:hypothetical protein